MFKITDVSPRSRIHLCCIGLTTALISQSVLATDRLTVSGFATLGTAVSNQAYDYQRFITNSPSLIRDSLLGVQLDAKINDQWSATYQGVLSAADNSDDRYELGTRWAFLSYRPTNDLLFRFGRLRAGSFLNLQNLEVGTSYAIARQPYEVYSLSPVYWVDGIGINKSWELNNDYELGLEITWGSLDAPWRYYQSAGQHPVFTSYPTQSRGFVLSLSNSEDLYRFAYYDIIIDAPSGSPFYKSIDVIDNNPLYGGGQLLQPSGAMNRMTARVITLGTSISLPDHYRFTAEYGRRLNDDVNTGTDASGIYTMISKRINKWEPYFYYARMWSEDSEVKQWRAIHNATPPMTLDPATNQYLSGLYQDTASSLSVYDQHTIALGSSYSLSPTQRLKGEIAYTRIGEHSSVVDQDVANSDLFVYSLSYSLAF
jgi:hypothetical protein